MRHVTNFNLSSKLNSQTLRCPNNLKIYVSFILKRSAGSSRFVYPPNNKSYFIIMLSQIQKEI